jgi:hypothetical protein
MAKGDGSSMPDRLPGRDRDLSETEKQLMEVFRDFRQLADLVRAEAKRRGHDTQVGTPLWKADKLLDEWNWPKD